MGHITKRSTYLIVYLALMGLLALTALAARFDLGPLNVPVAVGIAAAKAVLIALFFMHVRTAGHLVRIAAVGAFVWLAILFLLTFNDYLSRSWLPLPGI